MVEGDEGLLRELTEAAPTVGLATCGRPCPRVTGAPARLAKRTVSIWVVFGFCWCISQATVVLVPNVVGRQ
jgi:hypothetical protein